MRKRTALFGLSFWQLLAFEAGLIGLTLAALWSSARGLGLIPGFGGVFILLACQNVWLARLKVVTERAAFGLFFTEAAIACVLLALAVPPALILAGFFAAAAMVALRRVRLYPSDETVSIFRYLPPRDPGHFPLWLCALVQGLASMSVIVISQRFFRETGVKVSATVCFAAFTLGYSLLAGHNWRGHVPLIGMALAALYCGFPVMLYCHQDLGIDQFVGVAAGLVGAAIIGWSITKSDVKWTDRVWDPQRPIFPRRAAGRRALRPVTTNRWTPRAS